MASSTASGCSSNSLDRRRTPPSAARTGRSTRTRPRAVRTRGTRRRGPRWPRAAGPPRRSRSRRSPVGIVAQDRASSTACSRSLASPVNAASSSRPQQAPELRARAHAQLARRARRRAPAGRAGRRGARRAPRPSARAPAPGGPRSPARRCGRGWPADRRTRARSPPPRPGSWRQVAVDRAGRAAAGARGSRAPGGCVSGPRGSG